MDLTQTDEADLISLVREDNDAALRELTRRNEKIYSSVVGRFSFEHISGISQSEFMSEAPFRIREAAKKFDPSKETKFSTFLHYEVRFALLKLYRNPRSTEVPVSPQSHVMLDIEAEDEYDEERDALNDKALELFGEMLKDEDGRVGEIIAMRYPMDGESPKTWEEIGEAIGTSHEWARVLHNNFLKKVRKAVEKALGNPITPR